MTGYGEAIADGRRHRVTVRARSVNHRNLDVVVRVRAPFQALEPDLRAAVAAAVRRGRVEVGAEIEPARDAVDPEVDDAVVERLQRVVHRWRRRGLVTADLRPGELLAAVQGCRSEPGRSAAGPEARALAIDACRQAIAALVAERDREGRVLAASMRGHLGSLRACVGALEARRGTVAERMSGELGRRVGDLLEGGVLPDPDRLVQEVALLVERSDVGEELDRLEGHLDGFAAAVEEGGAVGRRLVFLSQEILRELNTVGSKCRDLEMQRTVVDGKVLCEQLREQAQNVE